MVDKIPLSKFRHAMGDEALGITDEQLAATMDGMYSLAQTMVGAFDEFTDRARDIDISDFALSPEQQASFEQHFAELGYDLSAPPQNHDLTRKDWEDGNF